MLCINFNSVFSVAGILFIKNLRFSPFFLKYEQQSNIILIFFIIYSGLDVLSENYYLQIIQLFYHL